MNDRDCIALLQWALPRLNHRWEGYRRVRRQVCRRIAARMQALGLADVAAYRARLEADAAEWTALRSCLKVTVSRFVRDRGVFHALSHSIFPALAEMALKSGADTLRAWSAGCASGEEPYSLSLLWAFDLQERWPQLRLSILATDIDAGVLRRAQMACYPASSLREVPRDWLGPGFLRDNGRFCLRPALRAPVRFLRQDLCEELPDDTFHLILCRNLAFTYFAEPLQQEIARNLLGRLMPGGCLILGTHERLPTGSEAVTTYGEAAGIYWKTAPGPAAARGGWACRPGTGGMMDRRRFLAGLLGIRSGLVTDSPMNEHQVMQTEQPSRGITLFLCGDVMTGRGIDQILPHPGKPYLFEPYMRSAVGYVELAEAVSGRIQRPVDFAYIWGDTLDAFRRLGPDRRIVNLETAVTASEDAWPNKGIHYRMHPANLPCLTAAGIDCCVLANNHVMDWGYKGLAETLDSLHRAGIATAGAGRDATEAAAPAVLDVPGKGRVLVFAWGMEDSGVPREWAARPAQPGVNFLPDLTARTLEAIARQVHAAKRAGDLVVASLHWGGNWGFAVSAQQRDFAHRLIDSAEVDVVYGHSSHHVKGIEVYRDKPVLYGCGDFLNDYEGIGDYEQYRGDLALMYFPTMEEGRLTHFAMTPTQTHRFRANPAPAADVRWLIATLNREGRQFGTQVVRLAEQDLLLHWR